MWTFIIGLALGTLAAVFGMAVPRGLEDWERLQKLPFGNELPVLGFLIPLSSASATWLFGSPELFAMMVLTFIAEMTLVVIGLYLYS